jgi:hypothetical protein
LLIVFKSAAADADAAAAASVCLVRRQAFFNEFYHPSILACHTSTFSNNNNVNAFPMLNE